ncbi:hypothetical protein [Amycolatopsis taiwanensis]|uniref:hypothetical protein n=1 Tax=Amycolatopsis taiwanensis TaxID=342230 RepID=UPI0004821242|nr:hypothetical protein [Amycolatopsis taiwanensis]
MNDQITPHEQRTQALCDLVELRIPVRAATSALSRFNWDSEDELVPLTRGDAIRVLRGYLDQTLNTEDIQLWAESLEGRDDVGREPGFADQLTEFLFEVATPELAGPLTPELAQRWIATFSTGSTHK